MVDLDRFKLVNDTFGHKTGDNVLVDVAQTLRRRLRATDAVARLGGDEFAMLLHETDTDGAQAVARDLAASLRSRRITTGGAMIEVTVSIGIVPLDSHTAGDDDALIAADRALYRAKDGGRDRVELAA